MQLLYLGPPDSLAHVKSELPGWTVHFAIDDSGVDSILKDCDAVLDAYMRVKFTPERLQRADRLKVFVTATTGADHIAAEVLASRSIPLLTLKGQREVLRNITPAAELSWLLLMACARNLRGASGHVSSGQWDRNLFPGLMLRGRTIGIIGCGRIGQWMTRYATAFGMQCLGYDPALAPWPTEIERCESLNDMLPRADIVSIHVNLENSTRGLLGAAEMARVKPGVIIINTSRGELIDEIALLKGLESGRIGAAGLDVLQGEPEIDHHPLVEYSRKNTNVVITPHIGGFSPDALRYVLSFSCGRVRDAFKIE